MKFNIFFEDKFVYRVGAEKPRVPEGASQKQGTDYFHERMEYLEQKLQALTDRCEERIAKLKGKRTRLSTRQRIKRLERTVKDIKEKIKKIKEMREKDREKAIDKVDKKLDEVMKREGVKAPEKKAQNPSEGASGTPSTKPEKGAKAPKGGPSESKIGPREYSKMNKRQEALIRSIGKSLVTNLNKINEVGYLRFDLKSVLEVRLNALIRILGQDPDKPHSNLKHHEYYKLPGGYSIALYKWKKNPDSKPNAMIYKGTDLVLYQQDGGLQAPSGETHIDKGRQYAEMVKCFHLFPQTFYVENGKMVIKNGKEDDFHKLLGDIMKFSGKFKWNVRIHGCALGYSPDQKGLIITPYNTNFKFIIKPPSPRMIFERGVEPDHIVYETTEKKEERATKLKNQEKAKKDAEKLKALQNREIERGKAKLEDRIDDKKYKSIVQKDINPKNPYEFRIIAKDKKAEKLISKTRINELLKLKNCKNVLFVTITGPDGKKKEGMFYPGQDTCYEMVNGKQTDQRVKFVKGDHFKIAFAEPSKEHYRKLNPKLKGNIKEPVKEKSELDDFKKLPTLKDFEQKDSAKKAQEQARLAKLKEQNEKNKANYEKMKKLLGTTFSKFKPSLNNPTEFRITSNSLAKLKLKDLFAGLKNFKDEAVRVSITDKSGKKRFGVCLPGQNPPAIYRIENGKQTNKEMKFFKNETINVEFSKPKPKPNGKK